MVKVVPAEGIKAKIFLDILQLPLMGFTGMPFIPPAFLTGIVASFLSQKRRPALILLISLFGALFSYVYVVLLSRETPSEMTVVSTAIGFFASLVCSLYIFRKN
jgi:O-antigen/teichoic acid export membrane protein